MSLTSLRLRVVSHTKERIYYHLPEKKKGEERKRKEEKEKGGERRRKECPIEAILNNQSVNYSKRVTECLARFYVIP